MILRPLFKVYNYYFSKEKDLVRKLKPILGFTPARIDVFRLAFYHRSMNQDLNKTGYNYNNERLEYLGDAILSCIVAEYLFHKYPGKDEGFLTKMRSKIVKRNTLNDIADKMGLDMILTEYSQGKMSSSMLGNALEALVGALYIEFGYNRASDYVIKHILRKYLDIHTLENLDDNHKSILLEWSQKQGRQISYKLVSKVKFDKRDYFKIAVYLDGQEVAEAEDFNKKAAEQKASEKAMAILQQQTA